MKQKQVEQKVKALLVEFPETRSNDHKLYYKYLWKHADDEFVIAFMYYKQMGLPCFESVSRARRKLQEKFPELRADKETEQARLKKEIDFYNYYIQEIRNGTTF